MISLNVTNPYFSDRRKIHFLYMYGSYYGSANVRNDSVKKREISITLCNHRKVNN